MHAIKRHSSDCDGKTSLDRRYSTEPRPVHWQAGSCILTPMIHPHSNETQTRWEHGDFKVQLNQVNNPRPMGFCDGTAADLAELEEIAVSEGADEMRIEKKTLKSGREIWTLHGGGGDE